MDEDALMTYPDFTRFVGTRMEGEMSRTLEFSALSLGFPSSVACDWYTFSRQGQLSLVCMSTLSSFAFCSHTTFAAAYL